MILKENIIGKHIILRTAKEEDAEFILGLRLDPALNKFIGKTDPSVDKQREWISLKQIEENDCHLIIENKDAKRVGVIAVYNIDYNNETFEWGRWIISKDAPVCVAIESALLVYDLAFNKLNLKKALFGVQKENKSVVSFHRSYADILQEDNNAIYFQFLKKNFYKLTSRFKKYANSET